MFGRSRRKNSCADPKVSARQPTERISDRSDSRTDASSSTMKTIESEDPIKVHPLEWRRYDFLRRFGAIVVLIGNVK